MIDGPRAMVSIGIQASQVSAALPGAVAVVALIRRLRLIDRLPSAAARGSALRLGSEKVETELFGQILADKLALDAVAGRIARRGEGAEPALARGDGDDTASAWLKWDEKRAERIDCAPYGPTRFRTALAAIRRLTREPVDDFRPRMIALCAAAGVAVVFTPELHGTHLSGAARWLSRAKALIQLSLRHKTDDHLWFTFCHEAAHIRLHGKREAFLDVADGKSNGKERKADAFAQDIPIPQSAWAGFHPRPGFISEPDIRACAERIGIAPDIVVARLPRTHLNGVKQR